MTRFDSRHRGRVLGLDVMHRDDGGLLLASCGQDGTVRIWRGVEGRPAAPAMTGHAGWVRAVRLVPARGRTMVVSGGDDGHVRRWDAATGDPVGDPVAPGGGLLTLAVVHAGPHSDSDRSYDRGSDRTMIVAGSDSGLVHRLDAVTGDLIGGPLDGGGGAVTALAAGHTRDGRRVLVSGTDAGALRFWDPSTSTGPKGSIEVGGAVTAVALAVLENGRDVVLVGTGDGLIHAWSLTGAPLGLRFAAHPRAVAALAVLRLPGCPEVLISAGVDGTLCRWLVGSARLLEPPLRELPGRLTTMAAVATSASLAWVVCAGEDQFVVTRAVANWSEPPDSGEVMRRRITPGRVLALGFPALATVGVIAGSVLIGRWRTHTATLPQLAGFVVVCGVAAMVALETVKRLLPVRSVYHRRQLARWLRRRSETGGDRAGRQLFGLLGNGSGRAVNWRSLGSGDAVGSVFNLPPEQFLAQVGLAVDRAMTEPERYPDLVRAFAPSSTRLMSRAGSSIDDPIDGSLDPDSFDDLAPGELSASIDQLQTWLAGRWRFHLQLTAWWLSGAIGAGLAASGAFPQLRSGVYVVAVLLFGGFFAWLSRDVVAAIERLRR